MSSIDNSPLVGKFEFNNAQNKVIFYVDPKIFPLSMIQRTAMQFRDVGWIAIDGSDDEVIIELKPKKASDLELLARQFNGILLGEVTSAMKIDTKNDSLVAQIKKIVHEFLSEQEGRISKQSIIAIGSILVGIGLAGLGVQDVSASHLCPGDGGCGGGCGDGCGCEGMGCCAACDVEGDAEGADGDGEGEGCEGCSEGEGCF